MTPTTDFREICARIEAGLTTTREAKVLTELVERLTWEPQDVLGEAGDFCRHCGNARGMGHEKGCPARGID